MDLKNAGGKASAHGVLLLNSNTIDVFYRGSSLIYKEKKIELCRAIVSMDKDGVANGAVQGRAEHIQTDLDDLVKNLDECYKKYGLHV
ncbi:uncharacterized protein J3R85_000604 [Psidium guajava]|nr:uncharacterized protein J3R85_000604 [Psidium guajava]